MVLTTLEIDLGQCNTYSSGQYQSNIVKIMNVIQNNFINNGLENSITLFRPLHSIFNVKKTGNTLEYLLILTFEEL